ncbi:hypothetical protein [Variovorax sp. KK3]|uniref:hypothetical protein n=1 Tax=Variovorax sp. KK3 TaxID=1855728 RepID=UPI00097C0CD7|nr:hypothetical protein [Variovorax sp. KK3]
MAPTVVLPFQEWSFHLFIGQRDFEGVTLGKAEVLRDGEVRFAINLAGKGPRAAVQDVLEEECMAWVSEQDVIEAETCDTATIRRSPSLA